MSVTNFTQFPIPAKQITATDVPFGNTDVGSELGRLDGKFGDYRTSAAQDVIDNAQNTKINTFSNRNLLDNPWFTINQRGFTTSSATSQAYTVDRWVASNPSHISVTSNGILIANDGYAVRQMSETELENGKTYTYSLLFSDGTIRSHTFTASSSVKRISHLIKTNTWEELGASYNIVAQFTQGDGVHVVRAVKLELGTVSTLANDVAPNYSEELLKCQRYYFEITALHLYGAFGIGTAVSSSRIDYAINFPTTMRTEPVFSYSGDFRNDKIGTSITSFSTDSINQNVARIISATSGASTGSSYILIARNDADAYFAFSADI